MDVPNPPEKRGAPASSLFLLVQIPLAMEMCSATFYTISSPCVPNFTPVHNAYIFINPWQWSDIASPSRLDSRHEIKALYEWFGEVIKVVCCEQFPRPLTFCFIHFAATSILTVFPEVSVVCVGNTLKIYYEYLFCVFVT